MSTFTDEELARLRRYEAARRRQAAHLRQAHGIDRPTSASRMEYPHQQAHRAENTPWHPAWYLDAADEAGPATVDSQDNAR
jgi:hypothetical protein